MADRLRRSTRELWRHPARFDGPEYPTRHDSDEQHVAPFDRAQNVVPAGAVVHGPLVGAWVRRDGVSMFDNR